MVVEWNAKQGVPFETIVGQGIRAGEGDILGLYLHETISDEPEAAAATTRVDPQSGLVLASWWHRCGRLGAGTAWETRP